MLVYCDAAQVKQCAVMKDVTEVHAGRHSAKDSESFFFPFLFYLLFSCAVTVLVHLREL